MDIKDVIAKKAELDHEIRGLVQKFMDETGCKVTVYVGTDEHASIGAQPILVARSEVKLEL